MSWRGSPSRCSASAPTPTSRSSSTTAWRWPSGSAPTAFTSANRDGDIREARALLGPAAQIGKTCHDSRHLAMEAGEAGADYVAFGAFYPTTTKPSHYRPDPSILTWWSTLFEIPCVAIGGITPDNAKPLVDAGADFLAVVPGGVGQGRSGRRGRACSAWNVLGRSRTPAREYHFVTIYLLARLDRPPSWVVHGLGLPSIAMLFQMTSADSGSSESRI